MNKLGFNFNHELASVTDAVGFTEESWGKTVDKMNGVLKAVNDDAAKGIPSCPSKVFERMLNEDTDNDIVRVLVLDGFMSLVKRG